MNSLFYGSTLWNFSPQKVPPFPKSSSFPVHHSADISSPRDPLLSSEEGGCQAVCWSEPSLLLISAHGSQSRWTRPTNMSSLAATRPPSNDTSSAVIKPCSLCSFPQVFPAITDQCVSWSMCCCVFFVFLFSNGMLTDGFLPPLMTNTCLIDYVWELVPHIVSIYHVFHTHTRNILSWQSIMEEPQLFFRSSHEQIKHVVRKLSTKTFFFPNGKLK